MGKGKCTLLFSILFLLAHATVTLSSAHGQTKGAASMSFTLHSADFANGAEIPKQFTCSGEDRSPALEWKDAPAGTKSFALIADDPDAPAGTWVHWVIYNIPATATGLSGGVQKKDKLADGTLQGRNDFGKSGYNGPCPPPGKPHRYFFKLYALDEVLNVGTGLSKAGLERAMDKHTLGHAEWMGTFRR